MQKCNVHLILEFSSQTLLRKDFVVQVSCVRGLKCFYAASCKSFLHLYRVHDKCFQSRKLCVSSKMPSVIKEVPPCPHFPVHTVLPDLSQYLH